jgi:hypothetical protein
MCRGVVVVVVVAVGDGKKLEGGCVLRGSEEEEKRSEGREKRNGVCRYLLFSATSRSVRAFSDEEGAANR